MDAYIVAAKRTAVGRAKRGTLAHVRSDDLAAEAIKGVLAERPDLDPAEIDDLIVGCAVPEAEQGMQMGRMISLLALPISVPGMIVNRYCGSGLEAINLAAARVSSGMAECLLVGGTESMSMVPMMGYRSAPNPGLIANHANYFLNMGLTAEEVAKENEITREDSDAFAYASHQRAIRALDSGAFEEQIAPVEVKRRVFAKGSVKEEKIVFSVDEGPRKDTSLEALARLRPVFKQNGQVTAGNSSQTSDGAAFLLVCSEKVLKRHGWTPLGRLCSYAVTGVDPRVMGIGPVAAIPKALKQANVSLSDMAHVEINEAFAAQVLAVCKQLDIAPDRVNPQGGGIALGHPLGCTGAKLAVQVLYALRKSGERYGLVSACVGGGQGVAGVFERL